MRNIFAAFLALAMHSSYSFADKKEPVAATATDTGSFIFPEVGNKDPSKSILNSREIIAVDYPDEGVELGRGWNTFLSRKTSGICVDGYSTENRTVVQKNTQFRSVDDREHLFRYLNISASGKYSGGAYSASGSASYSKTAKIDSRNFNLLATLAVTNRIQSLLPNKPSDRVAAGALNVGAAAIKLLQAHTPTGIAAFRASCGDAFVVGIRIGGEFNLLLSYATFNQELKEKLEAKANVSGLGASGSLEVSMGSEKETKHEALNYSMHEKGYSGIKNPSKLEDAISKFEKFSTAEDTNYSAAPLQVYLFPYSELVNFPTDGPTQSADFSWLDTLLNHYWRLTDLGGQYSLVLANPSQYRVSLTFDSTDKLIAVASEIHDTAVVNQQMVNQCYEEQLKGQVCTPEAIVAGWQNKNWNSDFNPFINTGVVEALESQLPLKFFDLKKFDLPVSEGFSKEKDNDTTDVDDTVAARKFYFWLGSSPLTNDEATPVLMLKVGEKADEDTVKKVKERLRYWIFANRLVPLSDSFCKISSRHMMCQSASALWNTASTISLNIGPSDLTEVKAATPPVKNEKRRLDPCKYNPPGRGGCPPV
jgi:hypothetical protein